MRFSLLILFLAFAMFAQCSAPDTLAPVPGKESDPAYDSDDGKAPWELKREQYDEIVAKWASRDEASAAQAAGLEAELKAAGLEGYMPGSGVEQIEAYRDRFKGPNERAAEKQQAVDAANERSAVPSATATPIPPIPKQPSATANANANLRAGPGMRYAVVGGVAKGEPVDVVGLDETGQWFELAGGVWIAARLVDNAPDVAPSATIVPVVPAPVLPTAIPTAIPTAAPLKAACSCGGNTYNCASFATHASAQACFNYCVSVGAGDIHWLDGDADGSACELLP